MVLKIKTFDELTKKELYEILLLRMDAFVVEQGGRYQDLDRIDYDSIHIFYEEADGSVVGCLRIFPKEEEPQTVQVGRVVSKDRLHGIGASLMDLAERTAKKRYGAKELYLTGRESAKGFYLKCGYRISSPPLGNIHGRYFEFRKKIQM